MKNLAYFAIFVATVLLGVWFDLAYRPKNTEKLSPTSTRDISSPSPKALDISFENLNHKNWEKRKKALVKIGHQGKLTREALVKKLRDPSWQIRIKALELVDSQMDGEEDLLKEVIPLLNDEDQGVRDRALKVICRHPQSSEKLLLQGLKNPNWAYRRASVRGLGHIEGEKEVILLALGRCQKDENSWVRRMAIKSLARWGEEAVAFLAEFLDDKNSEVRGKALVALGKKGKKARPVVDKILDCLADANSWVRMKALWAVEKTGLEFPEEVREVARLLGDKDWQTAVAAAKTLGALGEKSQGAIPFIEKALGSEVWPLRKEAALALGKIGHFSPSVVQALLLVLRDRISEVRWAAARSLGKMEKLSPKVKEALRLSVKHDTEYKVRLVAQAALEN